MKAICYRTKPLCASLLLSLAAFCARGDITLRIERLETEPRALILEWDSTTGQSYTLSAFSEFAPGATKSLFPVQATPPLNRFLIADAPTPVSFFQLSIPAPSRSTRERAHAVNKRLGRGNNFMAAKAMNGQGFPEDYVLLNRHHFNHCRIGYKLNEVVSAANDYAVPPEHLAEIRKMVDACLAQGLIAIIDPLHHWANGENYNDTAADQRRLQRIWEQTADYFSAYDLENVLFEIMNEPHADDNVATIIQIGLKAIRSSPGNEERIVIVSGDGFSTRQALIDALDLDEIPANDTHLIATFHYYDPRPFTAQFSRTQGTTWGTAADFAETANKFLEVVEANNRFAARHQTEPLPIYLGEFGVDNIADTYHHDRPRWLSWVRMQAEAHGFSWAHWNMYNNSDSSKGMGPWSTSQQTDASTRSFDAPIVEALLGRYEFEDGIPQAIEQVGGAVLGHTGEAYVRLDPSVGTRVQMKNVYAPRTDQYSVTVCYSSATPASLSISALTGSPVSVTLPPSGPAGSWMHHTFAIELTAGNDPEQDEEQILFELSGTDNILLDWMQISLPTQ